MYHAIVGNNKQCYRAFEFIKTHGILGYFDPGIEQSLQMNQSRVRVMKVRVPDETGSPVPL